MCKRFFTKVLLLGFLSLFVSCPDSVSPSIQFDFSVLDGSLDESNDVPGDLQNDAQKPDADIYDSKTLDTDIYDSKTDETTDIAVDLPPVDADSVMDVEFGRKDVYATEDVPDIKDVNTNDDIGPSDPCSSAFNPECKPNKCDDGDPETTNDHCQSWFGRCRCAGDIDTCSSKYNPKCSPFPCNDGDPNTSNDACRKDGKGNCFCKGISTSQDPCGSVLNPNCNPDACDDGNSSTTNDRCQNRFGGCRCAGDINNCSSQYNPQCMPMNCDDGDSTTSNDACRTDGSGNCVCKGIPVDQDPCGSKLNPDCDPKACDDGDPNTQDDKCRQIPFTNDCRCRGKHVW